MTDTEVLLAAADLIERNGLHKGDYWPDRPGPYMPGKPCCALGAIRVFVPRAHCAQRRAVSAMLAGVVGNVSQWSDDHTQAEVVATLRAVATSEETT